MKKVTYIILTILVAISVSCKSKSKPLEVLEIGSNFTLTDHNGNDFELTQLQGKIVFIFFGYTHCPDACPTTLSKIGAFYKKMGADADDVATLFISIDPKRDTIDKLKKYMGYFEYGPIGLVGTQKEITAVTNSYKIIAQKRMEGGKSGYLMDHSTSIFILGRQGKVRQLFNPLENVSTLISIVQLLKEEDN